MKIGESQHPLSGILSLVLIAGLGTPAFAQGTTSDIVTVSTPTGFSVTCIIDEAREGDILNLATPICSGDIPLDLIGLGGFANVVVFTEPASEGGGISDILLKSNKITALCATQLCFASDNDQTVLQGLLDAITQEYGGIMMTFVEETGAPQDVTRILFSADVEGISVLVQSDVEAGGGGEVVGGEILPIDMTALYVAGIFTNVLWILPMLGGIAGAAIALFKVKRRNYSTL